MTAAPITSNRSSVSGVAYRKLKNQIMLGLCIGGAAICIGLLFFILTYIVIKGIGGLSLEFFTDTPRPLGEAGGGVANAIVGTLIMVGIASAIAIPVGLGAGIFISEYASPRLGGTIRFVADVMTGIPSIVIGLFVYLVVVLAMGHFSGWAGGIALSIIMLPIMARSSEEMLKLVPTSQREAALALGIPRWRAIMSVVVPAATRGLVTGSLLAIARAAGETAPLIMTSLGSRFLTFNPNDEMDSLPLRIYRNAIGPYDAGHEQAWAAALVLVLMVFFFSILARLIAGGNTKQGR
jgi:phosphate transport system permease protein